MQLAQNWFRDWFNSPYYHQLYHYRDDNEANKFLNILISHLQAPQNAIMLDVACGRGRHAKALAAKGFDVTGIDIAPDSIAFAKQFESDHLHFYVHDMRLPFWINYYDYAFNFFTSFGYFRTEREHLNAIRTIAGALKENGVFVLDYINVDHFDKRIMIEDSNINEHCEYTERIAKILPENFSVMFEKYGLHIQEMFGDYDLHEFDKKNSPRLIMVAKKMID